MDLSKWIVTSKFQNLWSTLSQLVDSFDGRSITFG